MRKRTRHYGTTSGYLHMITGERLVFGTQHNRLPIACITAELANKLSVELNPEGVAEAVWTSERRAGSIEIETITHRRAINHPHGKKFWLLSSCPRP